MHKTLSHAKHSVLALAFLVASSACKFAEEAAAAAADTLPSGAGDVAKPRSAVQVRRSVIQPTMDVDSMDEAAVREALKRLQAQRANGTVQKTIRFNDGSDATFYAQGEELLDDRGRKTGKVAKGGEVKSARNSGTISMYGFGRNPISLYPSQWLELFEFAPEVVQYILNHQEHIDDYIAKKGNAERKINEDLLLFLSGAYEKGGLWTPVVEPSSTTEKTLEAANHDTDDTEGIEEGGEAVGA